MAPSRNGQKLAFPASSQCDDAGPRTAEVRNIGSMNRPGGIVPSEAWRASAGTAFADPRSESFHRRGHSKMAYWLVRNAVAVTFAIVVAGALVILK